MAALQVIGLLMLGEKKKKRRSHNRQILRLSLCFALPCFFFFFLVTLLALLQCFSWRTCLFTYLFII